VEKRRAQSEERDADEGRNRVDPAPAQKQKNQTRVDNMNKDRNGVVRGGIQAKNFIHRAKIKSLRERPEMPGLLRKKRKEGSRSFANRFVDKDEIILGKKVPHKRIETHHRGHGQQSEVDSVQMLRRHVLLRGRFRGPWFFLAGLCHGLRIICHQTRVFNNTRDRRRLPDGLQFSPKQVNANFFNAL
jgi:hypothetical protein